MRKTITIDATEYTVVTITAKVNRSISMFEEDGKTIRPDADFNRDLAIESLKAGGSEDPASFIDDLPDGMYDQESPYKQILKATLEVNGFKLAPKAPTGEAPAGESPA